MGVEGGSMRTLDEDVVQLLRRNEMVPAELFSLVVLQLHAIELELDQAGDETIDLPNAVVEKLTQGAALLTAMANAPDEWKPRLRELFTEALEKQDTVYMAGPTPEVRLDTHETWEVLRRAALTWPAVNEALRQAE